MAMATVVFVYVKTVPALARVTVASVVSAPTQVEYEVEMTSGPSRIRVIGTKTRPTRRVAIPTPTPPLTKTHVSL